MSKLVFAMLISRGATEKSAMIHLLTDEWILEGGPRFKLAITILGGFNLVFALLVIASIIHDAWPGRVWKLSLDSRNPSHSRLSLHPAEIVPFIISIVVVVQGAIFIGLQSITFKEVASFDCKVTAQVVWPALWIVPYAMVVFGLETTFRSLQRARFHPRGRWNIPLCLAAVPILTLLTWTPSNFSQSKGPCLTSLIWWTAAYAKLGIVIAASLILTYSLCALVITVQLLRKLQTDRNERIAAARVVYYLVASIILLALILPYYISIATHRPAIRTSEIAEVALNLFGIINGVLHVFLRSNADRLAIRAMATPWSQKRRLRIFGPSDLDMKMYISSPILRQKSFRESTDEFTVQWERHRDALPTLSPNRSNSSRARFEHLNCSTEPPVPQLSPVSQPPGAIVSRPAMQNRPNYSVYPTTASAIVRTSTSTAMSQDTEVPVQPPPPMSRPHERGFSGQSSATVQIGLRLSYLHRALDPVEQEPASPSLHLPLQLTSSVRPSSTGSSTIFTQPMDHSHLSSRETLQMPNLPSKAQIPDLASMTRSEGGPSIWAMGRTAPSEFESDDSLVGTTKPLPPVPLTLRVINSRP